MISSLLLLFIKNVIKIVLTNKLQNDIFVLYNKSKRTNSSIFQIFV